MTGILLATIKVAYLVLMWLFILFVANTIRGDLIGRTVTNGGIVAAGLKQAARKRREKPKRRELQHLVVVAGNQTGTRVDLPGALVLGRATDSGFDLSDDYASSHHARLYPQDDGRWVIEDLQSTNGTYVNGVRIVQPTLVGAKDVIRIGRTQLKLER
ncbi:Forkhead-associated protein [Propionibacterium freudenreichii]|uniref:FHA domain-containing protein FhaB/FipA n=1 Tax=Propionibacterium freudenreichii TaxID=1744 RepID=UPI0005A5CDB4|nr:FHA domain-containing protein [Propionibacterium freudenreichii]MDK9675134.1 FHA domain-containing protein [Propionibacterium freudenreichii]CEI48233.1 Forkhead-associated protein [Propionibacterium freudenreichii]SCQ45349.1 FHA domain protein [Propionibacterium freudenreichii]SCQ49523.1 FHA domain protein [Propionibacterium freudenreichii]